MYLLFGKTMALLVDSGDTAPPALLPIAATVRAQINARLAATGSASIGLAVCHTTCAWRPCDGDEQCPQRDRCRLGGNARTWLRSISIA
jgi:hypothetical protein